MSHTFSLTMFDGDVPGEVPTHQPCHPAMAASTETLLLTLRDAAAGAGLARNAQDWTENHPVFDVIDAYGGPIRPRGDRT